MATKIKDTSKVINLNEFKGLNQDIHGGETQVDLLESPDMLNFKVTRHYKLQKRNGYRRLFDSLGSKRVNGMSEMVVSGVKRLVFGCGDKLYYFIKGAKAPVEIGGIEDAPMTFFYMNDKLYMLNGYSYKSYDGTTLKDVEGTIPEVVRGAHPSGGGVTLDEINNLNGKRKAFYSADGTSKDYHLPESDLKAVHEVLINNVASTAYTSNLSTGVITFTTAPPNGAENVEITYEVKTDNREWITKCTHNMLYGGSNDTRVFIWGNPDAKNARIRSAVTDPEYFPANGYDLIGSDETAITDIVRQNARQVIYKENEAYYSYYEQQTINNILTAVFPVFALNSAIGNVAMGQVQIINESPYTLYHGVHNWVTTEVRDERVVKYMSNRVKPTLDEADLAKALTFDYQAEKEYWVCVDGKVWIKNYANDTWYFYNNINATCFLEVDGEVYFGDAEGQINRMAYEYTGDNFAPIKIYWHSGFSNLGAETNYKYMSDTWITLKPEVRSRINFTWRTNEGTADYQPETFSFNYSFANFDDVDFSNWSFQTNRNPQPMRFKTKAKKFAYIQFIIEDESATHHATLLEMNIKTREGSYIK